MDKDLELFEPVSELGIVKPELYRRLLGGEAIIAFDNDNIVLGSD